MLSKVSWSLLLPEALLMRNQNPGMPERHMCLDSLCASLGGDRRCSCSWGLLFCHFSQCWFTSNWRWKAWAVLETEKTVIYCLLSRKLFSPPTLGWLQRSEDGLYGSCHGIKASLTLFCFAFSLLTNFFLWVFISFHQFSCNFQSFLNGVQLQSHWSSSLGWPFADVCLRQL